MAFEESSAEAGPAGSRSMSRRTFVVTSGQLAALLSAGGLSGLLAACRSEVPTEATSPTATATPAATLQPSPDADLTDITIYGDLLPTLPAGGEADIALTQTADTLNPLAGAAGAISWMADPAHDFLERYDHEGRLLPSLAQSLEQPDDVTLRYTLHEGAVFHNGRPVTAEDVKKTIDWVMDEANASPRASHFEDVTVTVLDDQTVEFVLPKPDAAFRHHLPRIPVVPVEEMDSMAESPVGCGPYLFKEWVRDSHLVYEKNPDYWNPDAPRLDRLRLSLVADEQAAGSAFLGGQFDFLSSVNPAQASDFQSQADAGNFKTLSAHGGYSFVIPNHDKEPFDNPMVNKAMGLALDREAIAAAVGSAIGTVPVSTGPLPRDHPWYPNHLEVTRDVEAARQLLAEAGYPDGISGLTLGSLSVLTYENLAVVVQSNLADIGIQVDLEIIDVPTAIERLQAGDFDLQVLGTSLSTEPSVNLDPYFISDADTNWVAGNYSNPEVDEKLREARTIVGDDERRKQLYHEVMEIIYVEEPAVLATSSETSVMAYRNGTNGHQYRPVPGPLWHYPIVAVGL